MQSGCKIDGKDIKEWYYKNKLHRVDVPNIDHANGSKEWYYEDKCYRLDRLAIEHNNGLTQIPAYSETVLGPLHNI